jgi:3-phosphoshikimate 1-carboxyvinyltransferase
MAEGRSRAIRLGPGRDVAATIAAVRALGASVEGATISSAGVEAWRRPSIDIDAGNSATTMRLLAGAVAGRPFITTIRGDASLMRRPMGRLVAPLAALGASVEVSPAGTPPVVVSGAVLHGADITLPAPSAQVRTATALAAVQAGGVTTISSPEGYRDHTERWLGHLGLGAWLPDGRFEVRPGPVPPLEVALPGDSSSAAFCWVGAAIIPGARVATPRVTLNPGRVGLLEALSKMGAQVDVVVTEEVLGDPVGNVAVSGVALRGIELAGIDTLRALDELPALAVAAAHAVSPSTVAGAGELRAKESDRIASTVAMIRALGGEAEEAPDGFVVSPQALTGGSVDSGGDHRIAMAAAVAASRGVDVAVEGFGAAGVSWPGFAEALEAMWSSR